MNLKHLIIFIVVLLIVLVSYLIINKRDQFYFQGQIINNVYDSTLDQYVPGTPADTYPLPISLNVPHYTPEVSGPRPVDCDDSRYVPTKCGPLSCSIGDCDVNPLIV